MTHEQQEHLLRDIAANKSIDSISKIANEVISVSLGFEKYHKAIIQINKNIKESNKKIFSVEVGATIFLFISDSFENLKEKIENLK